MCIRLRKRPTCTPPRPLRPAWTQADLQVDIDGLMNRKIERGGHCKRKCNLLDVSSLWGRSEIVELVRFVGFCLYEEDKWKSWNNIIFFSKVPWWARTRSGEGASTLGMEDTEPTLSQPEGKLRNMNGSWARQPAFFSLHWSREQLYNQHSNNWILKPAKLTVQNIKAYLGSLRMTFWRCLWVFIDYIFFLQLKQRIRFLFSAFG